MPFQIVRNDIAKMSVDAVVNAANSELLAGGGVCGALFEGAGVAELTQACNAIGHCDVGDAVITPAFALPARYIIHAVGPVWQGGGACEADLLRSCYERSLALALAHGCTSIAFPLISTGIFGYPKKEVLDIVQAVVSEFLAQHDLEIHLVVYDRAAVSISEELFDSIRAYIDDIYVDESAFFGSARELNAYETGVLKDAGFSQDDEVMRAPQPRVLQADEVFLSAAVPCGVPAPTENLESLIENLDETFSNCLLRLIDERGMTDVEAYRRANISRKLFSKIRSNADYHPSKPTVLAFACALSLSLDETRALLEKAGFALSHSSKFDVIVEYFIAHKKYDIFEINETLFAFDQVLLGS
jgi:O-acetyl-ADP-ribose deacetylase